MRVFAGPNGSGKSTIIKSVSEYKERGKSLDFGVYVNADDIAKKLREGKFSFRQYGLRITPKEFKSVALDSGLIGDRFSREKFGLSFRLVGGSVIKLIKKGNDEIMAQIIADFLRKKLLSSKKKFSFETVFSHPGKLEIMKQAKANGYKVYLYFVSTESPEINKERVQIRVRNNGHDVPSDKIESRYFRSLDLLFDAAQIAYQVFFWDNSGSQPVMFAHFKMDGRKKKWDDIDNKAVPGWFRKYYSDKVIKK
jgi:predicted ABC-type ATPase